MRPGEARELAIFSYWLEKRVMAKRGLTACAFKRLCDSGKVQGFGLGEIVGPDSDTVSGQPSNADGWEQREEPFARTSSNPGSGCAQPGPSNARERSEVGRSPT